jgi:GNAT acetyltransferase-like protein
VTSARARLAVTALRPSEQPEWAQFLAASENGTLFHNLDFLAYHPPGRFRFQHLIVRRGGAIVALVPGGLAGDEAAPIFTSPLGASVGGAVLAPKLAARDHLEIVEALQEHAGAQGWSGIELTLPPAAYLPTGSDTLAFALFCRGFRLQQRWLCHMIPLEHGRRREGYRSLFRDTAANLVRAGQRKGVSVVEGGSERLDAFLSVFHDTYERHGAVPTHSAEEIANLLWRLPERVKLYLAMLGDVPVASVLVMLLNARVAYSFYICRSAAHPREHGNVVVFAALLDRLAEQGYRWLDMGPSARGGFFNEGVAFFKEGLGAVGCCRDRWLWSAPAGERAEQRWD